VAIAACGFAYMASNTVGASSAGEGAATVSGYSVYNIDYSGVPALGNPDTANCQLPSCNTGGGLSSTGTMNYLASQTVTIPVSGLSGGSVTAQDNVAYVSFQLSPDNAHWAAVQLYNSDGTLVGGGGASRCTEHTSPTQAPAYWGIQGNDTLGEGFFDSTAGIWTCDVGGSVGVGVPASEISILDVEAAQ
jgi:hypothetical protein